MIIKFCKNELVGINKEYVLGVVKAVQLSGGDARLYNWSPRFTSRRIILHAYELLDAFCKF